MNRYALVESELLDIQYNLDMSILKEEVKWATEKYNNYLEGIGQVFSNIGRGIKNAIDAIIKAITGLLEKIRKWFSNTFLKKKLNDAEKKAVGKNSTFKMINTNMLVELAKNINSYTGKPKEKFNFEGFLEKHELYMETSILESIKSMTNLLNYKDTIDSDLTKLLKRINKEKGGYIDESETNRRLRKTEMNLYKSFTEDDIASLQSLIKSSNFWLSKFNENMKLITEHTSTGDTGDKTA
jgi:hypothetical protein